MWCNDTWVLNYGPTYLAPPNSFNSELDKINWK